MKIGHILGIAPTEVLAFDAPLASAATAEARRVGGWLEVPELLTAIAERLDLLLIVTMQIGAGKRLGLKPSVFPRPTDRKREPVRMSWSQFAAAAEDGELRWQ